MRNMHSRTFLDISSRNSDSSHYNTSVQLIPKWFLLALPNRNPQTVGIISLTPTQWLLSERLPIYVQDNQFFFLPVGELKSGIDTNEKARKISCGAIGIPTNTFQILRLTEICSWSDPCRYGRTVGKVASRAYIQTTLCCHHWEFRCISNKKYIT